MNSTDRKPSTAATPIAERLCALDALGAEQDPIGSVSLTEGLLFIEVPTPWAGSFYDADATGTLQQRIRAVLSEHFEARRKGTTTPPDWGYRGVYAIAPDREWSPRGERRAILALRPRRPFAKYEMTEFSFPSDDFTPVELASAVVNDRYEAGQFSQYEVPRPPVRDLFVCTHGHVDICCAKFGIPLYTTLRGKSGVRAWRTSHFGGHRFAPTVKEFPAGYTWGFVDNDAADRIANHSGSMAELERSVRGWCGLEGPLQVLDRAGLVRYGWDWMTFERSGEVLSGDPEVGRWEGRIEFRRPTGEAGTISGVVTRRRELPNRGCGANWGESEYLSPEYALDEVHFSAELVGGEAR